jgi:hypothetical protein
MLHCDPYQAYAPGSTSNVPIKIGKTTKSDARRLFGDPDAHTSDDTVWEYRSIVTRGVGLWLPLIIPVHGGSIQPDKSEYLLFLMFDHGDILNDYDTINDDDENDPSGGAVKDPAREQKRLMLRNLSTDHMTNYQPP